MSEKWLLQKFKAIIYICLTFIYFGPPIISKVGNININDHFFSSKAFKGPSNIEAESLRKSGRAQRKIVYVPSIKIINKLLDMNNSKIDLISPSEENKENSFAVRDRKKDLPKRVDIPPPNAPSGLSITNKIDANKTKAESEKETTPTVQGFSGQGVSFQ